MDVESKKIASGYAYVWSDLLVKKIGNKLKNVIFCDLCIYANFPIHVAVQFF